MQDWRTVTIDLENTPLELKTESQVGSGEKARIDFMNGGSYTGLLEIKFDSTPYYSLIWCTSGRNYFLSDLPTGENMVWKITFTRTTDLRIQIHCNGVEVVNFVMTDETCSQAGWRSRWGKEVEKVLFVANNAFKYYRPYRSG